jgi:hypothetical protein
MVVAKKRVANNYGISKTKGHWTCNQPKIMANKHPCNKPY